LPLLISTLEFAKTCDHPIVIHVLTKKGKGFEAALKQPEKFHGLGPYDAKTGDTPAPRAGTPPNYQDVFGQTMVKLCRTNNHLVGITAAMPSGTGLKHLEKAMPDRYIDVGIAEEHGVIFAAGMATMGYRPVVAIYSTFLQRAYDCIHHDVCLQDLPVIFCMDRAGLSANDGPTHHGLFDIAYLRCLPNVIAMAPKDEDELQDMMFTATMINHPTFIRYPARGGAKACRSRSNRNCSKPARPRCCKASPTTADARWRCSGWATCAPFARKAAAELMRGGYDVALINPRFTKPLDAGAHEFYGRAADVVVTLEDHVLMGGYGSSVLELFGDRNIATPVIRIGWPDQFIEHATTQDELRRNTA
jgi:1-deoxy-D-xylulose-5-phosphate synthase